MPSDFARPTLYDISTNEQRLVSQAEVDKFWRVYQAMMLVLSEVQPAPQEQTIQVKQLPIGEGLPLPSFATPGSACRDAYAAVPAVIPPQGWVLIPFGFAVAIPRGFCLEILPRSGAALVNGMSLVNSPGIIDSDYRGGVGAIVINHHTTDDLVITRGARIAQLRLMRLTPWEFELVDELTPTSRRGGFGSTGI